VTLIYAKFGVDQIGVSKVRLTSCEAYWTTRYICSSTWNCFLQRVDQSRASFKINISVGKNTFRYKYLKYKYKYFRKNYLKCKYKYLKKYSPYLNS